MIYEIRHVLTNYHEYRAIIKKLEDEILVLETKQMGTCGSIIKMPEKNQNPQSKQIDYIMAKDKIQKRIDAYNFIFSIAEDFIKSVPPSSRGLVKDRFEKEMYYEALSKKYNYSQRHIMRKIKRLIERYADKNENI